MNWGHAYPKQSSANLGDSLGWQKNLESLQNTMEDLNHPPEARSHTGLAGNEAKGGGRPGSAVRDGGGAGDTGSGSDEVAAVVSCNGVCGGAAAKRPQGSLPPQLSRVPTCFDYICGDSVFKLKPYHFTAPLETLQTHTLKRNLKNMRIHLGYSHFPCILKGDLARLVAQHYTPQLCAPVGHHVCKMNQPSGLRR